MRDPLGLPRSPGGVLRSLGLRAPSSRLTGAPRCPGLPLVRSQSQAGGPQPLAPGRLTAFKPPASVGPAPSWAVPPSWEGLPRATWQGPPAQSPSRRGAHPPLPCHHHGLSEPRHPPDLKGPAPREGAPLHALSWAGRPFSAGALPMAGGGE